MYTALYRKYRPKTFDEMVGQDHIVKILKNQIKTGNTAHAYLFCGTRGTGKTSAARIFAKGVNCLSEGEKPCGKCENCESIQHGVFFDVIEIDAASNNRVDNIRELRESVKYPPAAGLCKVYIIDEVHMLSTGAFNALLKTLEEPPEHVIFILATTEPHKLPATILSRCLRLDFRRVSEAQIKEKLRQICDEQGILCEESALSLIAANGDGSVRDSLSILEQCIPAGGERLTRKDVADILGTAGEGLFLEITDRVVQGDTAGAYHVIERAARDGKDMRQFIKDWIFHFRNLMMSQFAEKLEDIMNLSCENVEKIKAQGADLGMGFLSAAITELSETANKARYSTQPRTLLELAVLKLSQPSLSEEKEALWQRLERLERALDSGQFQAVPTAAKTVPPNPQTSEAAGTSPGAPEPPAPAEIPSDPAPAPVQNRREEERREKEQPAAAPEPAAAEPAPPVSEPELLWKKAFDAAVGEKGSLRLLQGDVRPQGIRDRNLILSVSSALKKNMLEQNAPVFEKHLVSEAGQPLKIQVLLSEEPIDSKKMLEETKNQLADLLGADKLRFME